MIRDKWMKSVCGIIAIGMLGLISACGQLQGEQTGASASLVSGQPNTEAQQVQTKPVSSPYDVVPAPLTVDQCGQCHPGVFQKVKEKGMRHRFQCQNCHQQLHAFNPLKQNWAEIMPQCSTCHTEPPHGKAFTACLECHKNPHTPLAIDLDKNLAASCGTCHTNPQTQLTQFPSAHTEQGCTTCHASKHGQIPSCMECHTSHIPDQTLESCKSCHPVHKPLEVTYDSSAASAPTCGSCHESVFKEWSGTTSRHGKVACALCHDKHGKIPDCKQCHTAPHDAKILQKFPRCLDCHINVHDLPTKVK